MKKYIEWLREDGKLLRLRYEGKREDAEKCAFNISTVWKSETVKLIIEEKGVENAVLTIKRK